MNWAAYRCNDYRDSVMYGCVTRTSITVVSKLPRKSWGAMHVQQWIPGTLLSFFFQVPGNEATNVAEIWALGI